jgi:hypothetical protein
MPNGSVDSILRTGWQCQHQGAQEDHEARTRLTVQRDSTNEEWSMDFVAARLLDARWFLVRTLVDPFPREFLLDLTDSRLTGHKVAWALSQVIAERGAPVFDHRR